MFLRQYSGPTTKAEKKSFFLSGPAFAPLPTLLVFGTFLRLPLPDGNIRLLGSCFYDSIIVDGQDDLVASVYTAIAEIYRCDGDVVIYVITCVIGLYDSLTINH